MLNVSLIKALLLFYLIHNDYVKGLYSHQLNDLMEENRLIQHLYGYLIMLVIIVDSSKTKDLETILLYTTIGYAWFVFTTKLDIEWNIAIILLLTFGYLYENKMLNKELELEDDQALEDIDKRRIKGRHNKINKLLVWTIVLITIFGTLQYMSRKRMQYGDQFEISKYVFDANKKYRFVK